MPSNLALVRRVIIRLYLSIRGRREETVGVSMLRVREYESLITDRGRNQADTRGEKVIMVGELSKKEGKIKC